MKLHSIQFLRAVAALLVVYVHSIDLQMQFSVSRQQNFFYLQNFGAIGVDLFFVISGFIITYVANKYVGVGDGVQFLVKRFKRINPVYYVASVLYFGVFVLQLWMGGKLAGISLDHTISSFIDTMLIVPTTGTSFGYSPILMIGWSLGFEWLFYLLFLLLILSRTRYKALLFGIAITALVALGYLFKTPDFRYIFITNPIMLEFLLGVGICWIWLHVEKVPSWLSVACLFIGITSYILLIVFGFGWISELGAVLTGQLSMKRFLLWGLPSACIAFGCIFLEKNNRLSRIWNNKVLLLTGDASYSIYLVHLSVFGLLTMLYRQWGFFMPPDLAIVIQVVVATIISIGFYKWIEKPLIKAAQRTRIKKPEIISTPIPTPSPAPASVP